MEADKMKREETASELKTQNGQQTRVYQDMFFLTEAPRTWRLKLGASI
jgi:hypothetical protein